MKNTNKLGSVQEQRQFTIPKTFYDRLEIGKTETLKAYLMDEGLLLTPVKSEPVYERDMTKKIKLFKKMGKNHFLNSFFLLYYHQSYANISFAMTIR